MIIIITFILTGGINCENALHYLDAGASHVVVTSYVFRDGEVRSFFNFICYLYAKR